MTTPRRHPKHWKCATVHENDISLDEFRDVPGTGGLYKISKEGVVLLREHAQEFPHLGPGKITAAEPVRSRCFATEVGEMVERQAECPRVRDAGEQILAELTKGLGSGPGDPVRFDSVAIQKVFAGADVCIGPDGAADLVVEHRHRLDFLLCCT